MTIGPLAGECVSNMEPRILSVFAIMKDVPSMSDTGGKFVLGMGQKSNANDAVMLVVQSIAREEEFALNTERNTHDVATKDVRSEPRKAGFVLAMGLS